MFDSILSTSANITTTAISPLMATAIASSPSGPANTNGDIGASPVFVSPFIDEKQLCAHLGISSVTATKWRARLEGPAFLKVGRLVRYRRADVEAWLQSRTVGRTAAA